MYPPPPQPAVASPPPLRSADRSSNGPASGPFDPDTEAALAASVSLRCADRFLTTAPKGSFFNCLGERLGRHARERLALPFSVLYRVEELATAGALCPTLRGCACVLRARGAQLYPRFTLSVTGASVRQGLNVAVFDG